MIKRFIFGLLLLGLLTSSGAYPAFADQAGPSWSLPQPTGKILKPSMALDLRVNINDGDGIDGSAVTMFLDGKPLVASVVYGSTSETALAAYKWQSPTYGTHTVLVKGKDRVGNPSETMWSFTVSDLGPPALTLLSPKEDFSTLDLQPKFSIKLSDPDGNMDWATAVVTLNEKTAQGWRTASEEQYNYRNSRSDVINYTPVSPLDRDSIAVLKVAITDQAGNTTSGQWQFGVSTYRDMHLGTANSFYRYDDWELVGVNNKACTSCHQDNDLLKQNHSRCSSCHQDKLYFPKNNILTKDSTACINCHYGQTFVNGYAHNNAIASGNIKRPPSHGAIELASKHNSLPGDACLACHSKVISREHARHQDSMGKELRCVTCHNSSAPAEVLQAISNKDTGCSSCHTGVTHEQKHISSLDTKCQNCHQASLSEEHLKNQVTQTKTLTCDTCHNNPDPNVGQALAWGSKYCGSCHKNGHNLNIADKVPDDIPMLNGFIWSNPRMLTLWKGESWVPQDYLPGGKIIISNRRTDVSPVDITIFYKNNLVANGWTMTSPDPVPGSKDFQLSFRKGNKRVMVWYYAGPNHQAAPEVSAGGRVEVIYVADNSVQEMGVTTYAPPAIPGLVDYETANGTNYPAGSTVNVPLRWTGVTSPDGHEVQYQVQVSASADFSSIYHLSGWMSLNYMSSGWSGVPVKSGGTYYWRVRARDAIHWPDGAVSGWSLIDSFAVPGI